MKIKLKVKAPPARSAPLSATLTRPSHKNEGNARLERASALHIYPKLVESHESALFSVPEIQIEDFLLCCRYLYYCRNISIIDDILYDRYEAKQLRRNPDSMLAKVGSDVVTDYPDYVRALGLYFAFRHTQKKPPRKKLLIKRR